ncbi:hypothetical protein BsWGS_19114 [Bradybaena similaris]
MGAYVWTHPEHLIVALTGTVFNIASLIVCFLAFAVTTWFSNNRHNMDLQYSLVGMNVNCKYDMCLRVIAGEVADWQVTAFNLIFAGLVNNCVTTFLLVCAFWPLFLLTGKVVNPLLVTCRVLDFIGGYFKAVGACIYIAHAHNIAKQYVMRPYNFVLRLESLPLCLLLVSFLAELMSFAFLLVSTDRAPRSGGLTHLQRLELEKAQEAPEAEILDNRVSYMPDVKESHMRVLSQVQMQDASKKSMIQIEGTEV